MHMNTMQSLHIATEEMRWQLLNALGRGPKTSADLARELETMPQHCNFHLTQLEEVGLVSVSRVVPAEGGMKVKLYHLVPRTFIVEIGPKGARIRAE